MARVTVEDCLDKVENRFQLVLIASKRARQLAMGAEPRINTGKSKITITALREIAEGAITVDEIKKINLKPPVVVEPFHPDMQLDD